MSDTAIEALRYSEFPNSSDCISRQAAIDALARMMPRSYTPDGSHPADEEIFRAQEVFADCIEALEILPSAQPERLTDDDFETIRIHLNAHKERLCNQRRWEEAEEYQRIIDRFMGFASQPTIEPRRGKWIYNQKRGTVKIWTCSECGWNDIGEWNFCPNCGADMREEDDNEP